VSTGIREHAVGGASGAVRVREYRPPNPSSLLVWAHGGGFSGGSLDMPESDAVASALADAGHAVVAVDYRLVDAATRYPAPHDDVVTVLRWALEASDVPVFVGGASAGGNLAAGAALRTTREGRGPVGVVLAYPLLHRRVPDAAEAHTDETVPPEARFDPVKLAALVDAFAPEPEAEAEADAYAFIGDHPLAGFPRSLVIASESDDLRPSSEHFAADLAQAGGDVELVIEPGTLHGHLDLPGEPAFAATIQRIHAWMSRVSAG